MELTHLEDVNLGGCFFYLSVNKLIRNKMQNIFYFRTEHPDFIKYTFNKLDEIV